MPPRSARAKARVPQPVVAPSDDDDHNNAAAAAAGGPGYRAIIQQRLPEMPGLVSTAYGSAVATIPRSPMRGQQRNLQAVIDRALDQAHAPNHDDDADDLAEDSTLLHEEDEPEQAPVRRSGRRSTPARTTPLIHEDGMQDDDAVAPRERERLPAAPPVHKDPRIKTQKNTWVSMAPQEARARSTTPRASSQPPESVPPDDDAANRMTPRQGQVKSLASAFRRNLRAGSEPPSSVLDLDTSRSFANESVVFGDATISTPGSVAPPRRPARAINMTPLPEVPGENVAAPGQTRRQSTREPTPGAAASAETEAADDVDTQTPPPKRPGRKPRAKATPTAIKQTTPRSSGRPARARLDELKMEDVDAGLDEIPPTPEPSVHSATPGPGHPPVETRRANRAASAAAEAAQARRPSQPTVEPVAQPGTAPSRRSSRHRAPPSPVVGGDASVDAAAEEAEATSVQAWLADDFAGFSRSAFWVYRSVLVPLAVGVVILSMVLRVAFTVGGPSAARVIKPWLPTGWGANIVLLPTREADDFQDVLNRYSADIDFLGNFKGVDGRELAQIRSWIPQLVRLERNHKGDAVIPPAFWQALLGSIREEGIIMTFTKQRKDGYTIDRDEHWLAIKKRLEAEQQGADAVTNKELETYIADTLPRTLEDWVRNNDKKVAQILGQALDVKSDPGNVVITRAEFMERLASELKSARSEYRDEFRRQVPRLERLIEEGLAAVKAPHPPAGMTKAEVAALVKQLVKSAVASARLEAVSSGKVNADLALQLNQHINWMNPKAGAEVIPRFSSPDYQAVKGLQPEDPVAGYVRQNYVGKKEMALQPWEGEAECWCGSHGTDRHGRPKGVQLGVTLATAVIPTYLVVEHLPGTASVDPGARPRDIEVWAFIEEHEQRERALDFSAVHFPARNRYRDGMDDAEYDGFVKIGQFTWEDVPGRGGVNVFAFDDALREAPAVTDTVIVRATSNYGAPDHTCFYRVRLFGESEKMSKMPADY